MFKRWRSWRNARAAQKRAPVAPHDPLFGVAWGGWPTTYAFPRSGDYGKFIPLVEYQSEWSKK